LNFDKAHNKKRVAGADLGCCAAVAPEPEVWLAIRGKIDRELYYKEVIKGLGEKMLKDFRRIKESSQEK